MQTNSNEGLSVSSTFTCKLNPASSPVHKDVCLLCALTEALCCDKKGFTKAKRLCVLDSFKTSLQRWWK